MSLRKPRPAPTPAPSTFSMYGAAIPASGSSDYDVNPTKTPLAWAVVKANR